MVLILRTHKEYRNALMVRQVIILLERYYLPELQYLISMLILHTGLVEMYFLMYHRFAWILGLTKVFFKSLHFERSFHIMLERNLHRIVKYCFGFSANGYFHNAKFLSTSSYSQQNVALYVQIWILHL
jgi:hypothetical protein